MLLAGPRGVNDFALGFKLDLEETWLSLPLVPEATEVAAVFSELTETGEAALFCCGAAAWTPPVDETEVAGDASIVFAVVIPDKCEAG